MPRSARTSARTAQRLVQPGQPDLLDPHDRSDRHHRHGRGSAPMLAPLATRLFDWVEAQRRGHADSLPRRAAGISRWLRSATRSGLLGRLAQRGPVGELDARAPGSRRLAGGGLDRVDRLPALPGDRVLAVRRRSCLRCRRRTAGSGVPAAASSRILATVSWRILLVGADHAGRAALDPAGHVLAEAMRAGLVDDAAAVVADQATALVERDVAERLPGVADRAEHELRRDLLERSGAARSQRAVIARDDRVVLDLDRRARARLVAEHLDRRGAGSGSGR